MTEQTKDTVYVDIDDEITAIIDKVAQSKHKIVALVLPKRASVLQSVVNMKLLKRSGDTHKKKLVLITSESSLLPLAGAVKLHVAKTLQSKPAIPAAPEVISDDIDLDDQVAEANVADDIQDQDDIDEVEDIAEEDVTSDEKPSVDKKKTAAAAGATKKVVPASAIEETIDMADDPSDEAKPAAESGKSKGNKKLKIPNFDKFRTKLFLGLGALIILIVGWYVTNVVMPTAKIVIISDEIDVTADLNFTANTAINDFDADKGLVPAVEKQVKKTDTEKVPATGKKNIGDKASGSVDLQLTDCSQNKTTVPAGTVLTSGGLNFVTEKDISFNRVYIEEADACLNSSAPQFTTGSVRVVAQSPGDQYNLSGGRKFTVNGFNNVAGTDSSEMKGGTTKEVTVVSDQDVETARLRMADRSKAAAQTELKKALETDKMFSILETLAADPPALSPTPAVGSEASEVTVTSTTNYRMLGVKREQLKTLVVNSVKDDIDTKKQTIRNDGLNEAIFRLTERKSATEQTLSVQSTASTGAAIDEDALKQEVAGKKKGQVRDLILTRPGIKDVEVSYSPFWVYKTPSKASKITIEFKNAND